MSPKLRRLGTSVVALMMWVILFFFISSLVSELTPQMNRPGTISLIFAYSGFTRNEIAIAGLKPATSERNLKAVEPKVSLVQGRAESRANRKERMNEKPLSKLRKKNLEINRMEAQTIRCRILMIE